MDYAPDWSIHTPGVLTQVNDLVPTVNDTYLTSAPPVRTVGTPGAEVLGGALVRNTAGAGRMYAGTRVGLYEWNAGGASWTDRDGGTTYSTQTAGFWCFAQFGDACIAANGHSVLQAATGGNFADIAGAPRAKIVFEHENALIALNAVGNTDGWYRSDTGDYTQWSANASNGVDSGDLYGGIGGPITAGCSWQNLAIAWKASAMYGGIRVDDVDEIIRWQKISSDVGCVGQYAHIATEVGIIFVSDRDILLFDGSKPRSIADKVRRSFLRASYGNRAGIFLTHDESERCVYFWIPVAGSAYPVAAYVYNYKTGKWGYLSGISESVNVHSYLRCPLANANHSDYSDIVLNGATKTNDYSQVNAAFVETGVLVNFGHNDSTTLRRSTAKPTLTTGYSGSPLQDQTTRRLVVVSETTNPVNPEFASVTGLKPGMSLLGGNVVRTAAVNEFGSADVAATDRFFSAFVRWPGTGVARQEVKDVQIEFQPVAGGKR